MNSSVTILLIVISILLMRVRRQRGELAVSWRQLLAIFAAVLMLHAAVIGSLMAFDHFRHS